MATTVTHTSWGSRLGSSIKGIFVGILLFFGSFVLLWWNEHRAVLSYQDIHEMRNAASSVSAESLSENNDGNLVHVTGRAVTDAILTDPEFGVSANAIHLRREVEMFQWEEKIERKTQKKLGGGETVTETPVYRKIWSGRLIDSTDFREPAGHQNPATLPYGDWGGQANKVTLGAFSLDTTLIRDLSFYETLPPREGNLLEAGNVQGDYIFKGENMQSPQVGDVRISFQIVPQDIISVVARQARGLLVPWSNSRGKSDFRIQRGEHTLVAMMEQAKKEAQMMAWILRGAGWLLMTIGLASIFKPLSVLGDVVPFIGNLIGGGIGLISALVSLGLSLITIGIAWVAVRPLVGVPLLVAAGGLLVWRLLKSRKPAPVAA